MTASEVASRSTPEQARARADRIRGNLTAAYVDVTDAWRHRDDLALGYESWDAYCAGEFTEGRMVRLDREQRREIVAAMRSEGLSTRAIGSALGICDATVRRDTPGASPDAPGSVVGLDGKTYAPRQEPVPAITAWVESDQTLKDTGYAVAVMKAVEKAGHLCLLDPERTAQVIDQSDVQVLEMHAAAVARFVERVQRARAGLRVISGGMA
ncbi:MAG: hypothetical protein LC798_10935 [Chloroflexi bacterium]|nr:hypothetical protein [Chloroflexota bacterium]